ncbi:MAG: hypothetical protein K6F35_12265 [Lachnospiraceae bacterium]|nr:hypothetical protein [Lachnospiraceae bacterium]
MAKSDFEKVLKGKNIPVLTLDNKWHKLFNNGQSKEIKRQEAVVNDLLKEQGRLNDEMKKLRKLKADLMDDVVANMPEEGKKSDPAADKKMQKDRKMIDEINHRMEEYDDRLLDLPKRLDEENIRLMLMTMDVCYEELLENTEDIENIGAWIKSMRMELKRNILKKQQMEVKNVELYSYMHDIFGPEVISIFDIKYDVEAKKQAIIAAAEAKAEEMRRKKLLEGDG